MRKGTTVSFQRRWRSRSPTGITCSRRGDRWTPPAGVFVYCGSFSALAPVMKPQTVAEMDFPQCYAAQHTPSRQRPLGPVCVGAAKITKECGELVAAGGFKPRLSHLIFFFPPSDAWQLLRRFLALVSGFSSFTCGLSDPSTLAHYARPPRDKPQNIAGLTARTIVGSALGDLWWDEYAITKVRRGRWESCCGSDGKTYTRR